MLVMFGVFAGLAVLEVTLHLFPGLLPSAVRQALAIYADSHQTSEINRPFVANDDLIYVPRPNVDIEIHDGLTLQYSVQTRSAGDPSVGFRDSGPVTPAYAIAVGDSFTWGTYVEAAQTWPEQLQAELNAPVINLGVLGYGPIQYQIVTEKYGLPLRPEIILWGVFTGNDFVNATEYSDWINKGKPDTGLTEPEAGPLSDFLSRHSRLVELVKFALRKGIYYQRSASSEVVAIAARGGPDWTFYPDVVERQADSRRADVSEGWDLTRQALLKTESEVKAAGAQFVVVIIPPKELVYWDVLRKRLADPTAYNLAEPIRMLVTLCQAENLLCLDLTPTFIDHTRAGEELYFRQDAHLNAAGHRLAAELIAAYLDKQVQRP
jgi:hypothetical protein